MSKQNVHTNSDATRGYVQISHKLWIKLIDKMFQQDQLDDAHRPGEEKKEEERDCKEEEKGVNMTDDFDSHLQDVDKKGLYNF